MNDSNLKKFRENLGKKIKKRRLELDLTQLQLAIRLGNKDKQVVNRYEKAGANPTIFNFIELAKALEYTLDELLDFSDLEN